MSVTLRSHTPKQQSRPAEPKLARDGHYGAAPYDPTEMYARAMLDGISTELRDADFFQREDLLHLKCFQHVSTITRYRYICDAVHWLLEGGKLVAKSRSDLCLPGKAKAYDAISETPLVERYDRQVHRLVTQQKGPFTVDDLLRAWRADPHISLNSKRVALRTVLGQMVRHRELQRDGFLYMSHE